MSQEDSIFVPESIKVILKAENIQKIKNVSIYSEEEQEILKKLEIKKAEADKIREIQYQAKLNETYKKFNLFK